MSVTTCNSRNFHTPPHDYGGVLRLTFWYLSVHPSIPTYHFQSITRVLIDRIPSIFAHIIVIGDEKYGIINGQHMFFKRVIALVHIGKNVF